jgi:hypothetical protein
MAIAVTLALALGGTGIADAATGGNFVLGRANRESSTASLASSRGAPLSLSAPAGTAPLAVNRKALVKNLNAQYTGGLTAGQLRATGGDGFTSPGTVTRIDQSGELVAATGHLPAGTYYVTAAAEVDIAGGDVFGLCYIAKGSDPRTMIQAGSSDREGIDQLAETAAVSVAAGDTVQEWCKTRDFNGSTTLDTGIIAIRILSSSGTPPA